MRERVKAGCFALNYMGLRGVAIGAAEPGAPIGWLTGRPRGSMGSAFGEDEAGMREEGNEGPLGFLAFTTPSLLFAQTRDAVR